MTNILGTPEKGPMRRKLFALALDALAQDGWEVTRARGGGGASVRDIRRGAEQGRVSIRTSQDSWIAFPRNRTNDGWGTLDDVDYVVAASVNRKHEPDRAAVHLIPTKDAKARFDRAYKARKDSGYIMHVGRGLWISLYDKESSDPVSHVGAGLGHALEQKTLADVSLAELSKLDVASGAENEEPYDDAGSAVDPLPARVATATMASQAIPLTIAEAKRRLSETLGVPESSIRITIEH